MTCDLGSEVSGEGLIATQSVLVSKQQSEQTFVRRKVQVNKHHLIFSTSLSLSLYALILQ